MNAERRKAIAAIIANLEELQGMRDNIKEQIEALRDEEQEYFDNMPESFQGGDKGERATAAIDAMQEAYDALDGFDFDEVTGPLETATE